MKKKVRGFGPTFLATLLALCFLLAAAPATAGPILGPTPSVIETICPTKVVGTSDCYIGGMVLSPEGEYIDANLFAVVPPLSTWPPPPTGADFIGASNQFGSAFWLNSYFNYNPFPGSLVVASNLTIVSPPGTQASVYFNGVYLGGVPSGQTVIFDLIDRLWLGWNTVQTDAWDSGGGGLEFLAGTIKVLGTNPAIPEPASMALVGVGLLALGIVRRRRTATK